MKKKNDRSVGKATELWAGLDGLELEAQREQEIPTFSETFGLALGSVQPHTNGYRGSF